MTFRAIDILKSVSIVAAEDTRQSAQLFKHYNISTPSPHAMITMKVTKLNN
jgi:16S rRNA (cytidine1402-2'-O)-methyltransferase